MAERPVAIIVTGRGGVPTIPDQPQGTPGIQDCAGECTGPLYKHLGASFTPAAIAAGHNPGKSKSQKKLDAAMSETFHNPPSTLKPGQSKEKRRKQMVAIAFAKARARGAKV